jgi:hypothetical protein
VLANAVGRRRKRLRAMIVSIHDTALAEYQAALEMYREQLAGFRTREAQKKAHNRRNLEAWEQARHRWHTLHYCEGDDCVFIPGEPGVQPSENTQSFLYQSPRPS